MERLNDGLPGSFADSSLFFYSLHARQWLLIALARAAQEAPTILRHHLAVMTEVALGGSPHVLCRRFAAEAAMSVADAIPGLISGDNLLRLRKVNESPFEAVVSKRFERYAGAAGGSKVHSPESEPRFLMGYEFTKNWPESLAHHFAVSAGYVGRMIEEVVWDDWQLQETGHWERDERGKRKHFERRNSYSYGDDERCSNLSNYLAYHAIMTVAGKLLRTTPTHQDPDETDDSFTGWLNGHALTRSDGVWLADRRDPAPGLAVVGAIVSSDEEWPTSVQRDHFKKHLNLQDGRTIVAGRWTVRNGRQIEEVRVSTALVSPDQAMALVRALQCARSPFEHHLPKAGDEWEVEHGSFRLRGWTTDPRDVKGLDQYDPWSGSIEYPACAPADTFVQMLGLSSDKLQRSWAQSGDGSSAATLGCTIWGTWEDSDPDDYYEGGRNSGSVLAASSDLLLRLLAETSMQLIFDVRTDRSLARSRYGSDSDDSPGYTFPYAGILLLTSDGHYSSIV